MNRNIDVRTEMHKITSRKPVQAAAGVGALASQTLRDLTERIAKWREEHPVTGLPTRATGYVHSARAKAAEGYDMLADRGKQVISERQNGHHVTGDKPALNGTATTNGKAAPRTRSTTKATGTSKTASK